MGCFLACFGGPKERKRRRRPPSVPRVHESSKPGPSPPKELSPQAAIGSPLKLRENQEPGSFVSCRKKVTFDMNVKTYENVAQEDSKDFLDNDMPKKEVEEEGKANEGIQGKISAHLATYPPNYRYQACVTIDEDVADDGDDDYEDCDFDDDEEDEESGDGKTEEESYDSYFSLPMDKDNEISQEVDSTKLATEPSLDDEQHKLFSIGNARDRTLYVHPVLNPIENIGQWNEAKARVAAPVNRSEKENKKFEPTQKQHSAKQQVSVDASLSTWLLTPEKLIGEGLQGTNSHNRSNSSVSREEQPILGALTVEDLKQSEVSSARRSPSKSPDEKPILGVVGSYWSCSREEEEDGAVSSRVRLDVKGGIPNTTSKYREDKRVNWHSTPFEVRLERALNKEGAAEACSS